MASRLEMLPAELLTGLIKFIPRPSDRRTLCHLSKTIHNCALPALYNTIALDTDSPSVQPDADSGLLRIGNPGIVHVRRLSIVAINGLHDCEKETRFLRMFLLTLPRDKLQHLECPSLKVDEATIFTLLAQQRSLKSIALGPVMCDFARMVKKDTALWNGLQEFSIPIIMGCDDLKAYQYLVKRTTHLAALSVSCNGTLKLGAAIFQHLRSSTDGIERKVFPHINPKDATSRLRVTRLALSNITIQQGLLEFFDISQLQSLKLSNCVSADYAFDGILAAIEQGQICNLRELSYDAGEGGLFYHDHAQNLLKAFIGLKKLSLLFLDAEEEDIEEDGLDLRCLEGHKATLEALTIGCNHIDQSSYQEIVNVDFAYLATFTKLRQLSIPMPRIEIPCAVDAATELLEYTAAFELLTSNLPDLHTLRIMNLPRAAYESFHMLADNDKDFARSQTINVKAFCSDLDEFVAKRLAPVMNRVKVLCMGLKCSTNDGAAADLILEPMVYAAEQRVDLFGSVSMAASRTSLSMACFIDPEIVVDDWVPKIV